MENIKKYVVYCHTLKKDGRSYIGTTCKKPEHRWNNGKGYTQNKHFYNAIKKYGWDAFEHKIMFDNLCFETAMQLEIMLIGLFETNKQEYGFNVYRGGDKGALGYKFSNEQKMKISLALKGVIFTDERKKHISESKKGKRCNRQNYHHSEETKKKIGEANRNVVHQKHSEEQKKKIGISLTNHPKLSKKVYCLETGTIYTSVHDANRLLGIDYSNISACCRGVYKQTHGYHFSYAESEV